SVLRARSHSDLRDRRHRQRLHRPSRRASLEWEGSPCRNGDRCIASVVRSKKRPGLPASTKGNPARLADAALERGRPFWIRGANPTQIAPRCLRRRSFSNYLIYYITILIV